MWIACWNCGHDVWIETQKECRNCSEVTHRCADCSNFLKASAHCAKLNIPINPAEADVPTRLALSSTCTSFALSDAARKRPRLPQGAATGAATAATRPTAAQAAPTATPATATAATNHGALGDVEVITIVREPAPRRPKHAIAIAHRGDSSAAPENTLAAFGAALPHCQAVELDVHLSSDGHAVVTHDATVDRCSNGTGAVHDLTLAELKALDVGSWFAAEFAGERMPTLDEAIAAVPAPTLLFIHLRAHENDTDRCEKAVAEAVARTSIRGRTVVTHHTRHGLRRLRELDPKLHLCWIGPGGEPASEYLDDAYYMGYRFVHPRANEIDEAVIAYAHEHGMWVNAFWTDDLAEMQRLVKLGVDGIITNHPAQLHEAVAAATTTA